MSSLIDMLLSYIEAKGPALATTALGAFLVPVLTKFGVLSTDASNFSNATVAVVFSALVYFIHHHGTTTADPATPAAK